jgi:transketolase
LAAQGIGSRVVSLPSWELFERQPAAYRQAVLPDALDRRLALEAGTSFGWSRYLGTGRSATVTIDTFGASAPAGDLARAFGFTAERVIEKVRSLL